MALTCVVAIAVAQNKETRSLSAFDRVDISGGFEIVALQEGSKESISIEAAGIDLEKIETKVLGNTLKIGIKRGWYDNARIKLYITYRQINEINNSGSSNIDLQSTVKGESFVVNSSGSGNVTGSFEVRRLEINISGSSDMRLQGTADRQDISISGSGDVDASRLSGNEASVVVSGSGDVQLNVKGRVRTTVSGSGDVVNRQ